MFGESKIYIFKDFILTSIFRFVPLEDVDINCLIDIGGKDLGQLTVTKTDKRSLEDLADFMKGKIGVVKSDKDIQHKKKVASAR